MVKLTKAQRLERDFREYNKRQKRYGLEPKTFKEYTQMLKGKSRYKPKVTKSGLEATTLIRNAPKYESGDPIGSGSTARREKRYTGSNLIGIGTMHKSNMVPIFKMEDAEDIAKMRRN